jgi:hypothetical protein
MSEIISAARTAQERLDALMVDARLSSAEARVGWVILDRLVRSNTWTAELTLSETSNAAHLSRRTVQHACARLATFACLTIRHQPGRASLYSGSTEAIGASEAA